MILAKFKEIVDVKFGNLNINSIFGGKSLIWSKDSLNFKFFRYYEQNFQKYFKGVYSDKSEFDNIICSKPEVENIIKDNNNYFMSVNLLKLIKNLTESLKFKPFFKNSKRKTSDKS